MNSQLMNKSIKAFRGKIFHYPDQVKTETVASEYKYIENGYLLVKNGRIVETGELKSLNDIRKRTSEIYDFSDCFIFPGFIDAHIHSVQTGVIASYGKELLGWLKNFIFPNERHFANKEYALKHTRFFIEELLRNGTTTAAVFPSIHKESVDALFEIACDYNMRIIAGKTCMNRNAPDYLIESSEESYKLSKSLIEKWHGKARLNYALTPRFAITSTPKAMEAASFLLKEFQDLYVQTHISENKREMTVVNNVYPKNHHYLDVYDSFGLLTKRTLLAHGIYLEDKELQRIAETGASIVHCPSSNLFLGSGLFSLRKVREYGIPVAIGSDIGAGTSFSMLQNLNEAYKIAALQNININPFEALYLITLGGARALSLDKMIGNFEPGKEADFIVIDPSNIPLLKYRLNEASSLEEILFALIMLGDERIIKATILMGETVFKRE